MLHLLMLILLKCWRCLHIRRQNLLADLLLEHLQKGRLLILVASTLEHQVGVSGVVAHWTRGCPCLMLTVLEYDSRAR